MSDPVSGTYRSKEEVEERKREDDPITRLRDSLLDAELLTQEELEAFDGQAREIVAEAVRFADESPAPSPEDLYTHIYAEINEHGRLFLDGRDR
jgi:pyruvate dehydrogenase E1 component alpha subunit